MAITIQVTNSYLHLTGVCDDFARRLDAFTSYPVDGAEWSEAYRNHFWDGKEHLFKRNRSGGYVLPTGLVSEITPLFPTDTVWVDKRKKLGNRREFGWIGAESRDYQLAAVDAALRDRSWGTGRGLLNMPIRSGKTHTACRIISQLGCQTLFLVPSDMLLHQTREVICKNLDPSPVGVIGDGRWCPDWITVATVQSLLAHQDKAKQLLASCDLLFFDEAHKLEAPIWRELAMRADARFKFGLSGSIKVATLSPSELSSIWLKACTGPILHRISMARLIDSGFLLRPNVLFYDISHEIGETFSYHRAYKELVCLSAKRNSAIADLAADAVSRGLRVIIDTGRLDQMEDVRRIVCSRGLQVEVIHGGTKPTAKRWRILDDLVSRRIDVVVGTVLGEGIDIPELEVVINAEGQSSRKAAIQRMRNLTPSPDKGPAIFIDFTDKTNRYLRGHSAERLNIYRSIRGFIVREMEPIYKLPEG